MGDEPPQADDDIVGRISKEDIDRARAMLRGIAVRTPLLPLADAGDRAVFLKPECIQPSGSFKVRCGSYAVLSAPADRLDRGIYTASAGNFGQGVAATAARRDIPVRVYAPDGAARTKLAAMRALGAEVVEVPFARWWEILSGAVPDGEGAYLLHPCRGREVLIGNATIAAEILEDAPDIDAILVPFGGGGLVLGIAAAVRALAPHVRVIACEARSSMSLAAAWGAGRPVEVESDPTSFIDGIGGSMVLPSSWPMLRRHVDAVEVVEDRDAAAMVARLLRSQRLVVEGAGAVPVVAALRSPALRGKRCAAVISGGNIDERVLVDILATHPAAVRA